jgi:hypothetical protein
MTARRISRSDSWANGDALRAHPAVSQRINGSDAAAMVQLKPAFM